MCLRARRISSSARKRMWSSPAGEARTSIASMSSSASTCSSGSSMRMRMRQPSAARARRSATTPGWDARLGMTISIRSTAAPRSSAAFGAAGSDEVRVARDHVAGLVCRRLERTGRGRGGSGVGPERVLGRVERARDTGAVPRIRGATREPAPHGLDVDLNDVGELLERQAGAGHRGPQLLVLQDRLRLPESCRFPALPV